MLKQKTFIRKTKRGSILKVVREHYLRDDIYCGVPRCAECPNADALEGGLVVGPLIAEDVPVSKSSLFPVPHILVVDANVVLHQLDVLEDEAIANVVVLQTVLQEVRHRSGPTLKRFKDSLANGDKHFYAFVNEHHKDAYVEQAKGETANDRNDRAIRHAAKWYQRHLSLHCPQVSVVMLTDDRENKRRATDEGLRVFTTREYVESLSGCEGLTDKVARRGEEEEEMEEDATERREKRGRELEFPVHLPMAEIQAGIKSGKFLQGTYFASAYNYLEGSVLTQMDEVDKKLGFEKGGGGDDDYGVGSAPILVQGMTHVNRAVNGDKVAVEVFDRSKWSRPSNLILMEETHDKDDEAEKENLHGEDPPTTRNDSDAKPTGRVVGIIKRNWRQYCGILKPSAIKDTVRHLFIPAEKKIPKIRIETRQAASLIDQRIIVAIDSWPRNSFYPLGHFVRRLGAIGDKETENEVLLLEHDVPHGPFSASVLKCLPSLPWRITEEMLENREDLRHLNICSVDPPGCTDIDDALHCRPLENGNLEVGVHIADVSHFIKPGSAIDLEAASRGTTVYLVDKRIDMVPELLSGNLCSLRGGEERLAFSCIWEMTQNAEILKTRFTKSAILSKAAMTYAEAQMRIDGPDDDVLTLGLRSLNRLAKILKRRRIDAGALSLASTEVRFHLDSETHDPVEVQTKQLLETMSMVEEFMLLANISTAEATLEAFGQCAVLRRHPAPPPSNYEPIVKIAAAKGFDLDVNSNKGLATTLGQAEVPGFPFFNVMLRILATRCMMQALYFCSGTLPEPEYAHYGLACPIYTHFTSPIRRYSDILVHRLLASLIQSDRTYPEMLDKKKVEKVCNNLNYRKRMADYAGRASVALHTQLFFANRKQVEQGYVLFVRKNALQILIPKYGLEGTLFLADKRKKETNSADWIFDEDVPSQTCGGVVLRTFDPVSVQVSIDRRDVQHQKMVIQLVKPVVPGFSVTPKKPMEKSAENSNDADNEEMETTNEKDEPPAKRRKS